MDELQRASQLETTSPSIYKRETKDSQEIPRIHKDPEGRRHKLESPEWQDRLKKLLQWRRQARVAQSDNRTEMAMDEDFYDSIQYEPEDLHIMEERNQPPLVFNVIKNTLNWIIGTELKSRVDYRILPRTKDGAPVAKIKTKLFKYIQDISRGEYHRSQAFQECVKAGLGWLEVAVRNNPDEPIFIRAERWRNMWFDHLGLESDCSDWRYEFREKWVDLDVLQAMFPEREDELKVLAEGVNSLYPYLPDDVVVTDNASEFDLESDLDSLFGGPWDGARQRVKAVECWYRMPERVKLLHMIDETTPYGALDRTIFREDHEDQKYLVKNGYFTTFELSMLIVRCAIWAGATYLQDIQTPYNHNRFPLIPLFCYRRKRDNMPYGVVRDLRDPQSDLNKRRSRALFLLSSDRTMYEKGAITNPTKFFDEMHRPDGQAEVEPGALAGGKIKVQEHVNLASAHVELAKDDEEFIYKSAGVTRENVGETQKDLSGKAILSLQSQGQTGTGVLFDNYYFAFQYAGEIIASLIEQFIDREKQILVTGDQAKDEFLLINHMNEQGIIENNLAQERSRFIVGKQDFRESIRAAMLENLTTIVMGLSKTMPEMALAMLDLVVEYMDDLPNREEMIARIRKINKQHAPEDEMTPEEKEQFKQTEQASMAQQQVLQQFQMAMAQAQLAIKQAEAAHKENQAIKTRIDAQMKKLEGFLKALEVAGVIRNTPQLVGAADTLIAESQAAPEGGNGGAAPPRTLGNRGQIPR